jgi:hypothetical protein
MKIDSNTIGYTLIKKYFNSDSVSKKYFDNNTKKETSLNKIYNLNLKYNLNYDPNMYFFYVWYCESVEFKIWAKDVELFKLQNQTKKDNLKLLELISFFDLSYDISNSNHDNILNSIKFEFLDKKNIPTTFSIKSHSLMFDILKLLEQEFNSNESIEFDTNIKNPKTYIVQLIEDLIPFEDYLKDFHVNNLKNKKDRYRFLADFLIICGVDFLDIATLPEDYIKDIIIRKKRKTTT